MVNTSPKTYLLYFSMITNNISRMAFSRDFNALHIFLNSVLFCEGCYILHYTLVFVIAFLRTYMFSFLYPLYMDFNQMILRATLHYILYLKCRSYSIKSLNLLVKVYNFNLLYTLTKMTR